MANTDIMTPSVQDARSIFLSELIESTPIIQVLKQLKQTKQLAEIDYQFACFAAAELYPCIEPTDDIMNMPAFNLQVLIAATLSYEFNQQNTCFNLLGLMNYPWSASLSTINFPAHGLWQSILQASPLFGPQNPFRFENGLVYFQRCYKQEANVADYIIAGQTKQPAHHWLPQELLNDHSEVVEQWFRSSAEGAIDWQRRAVMNSLSHKFSVITGGPGTGKTTTVLKLLASLVELYLQQGELVKKQVGTLSIKLVAPTGKAALRLTESILGGLAKLELSNDIANLIPTEATTIHRLLKPRGSNGFYYNEINKLPLDVLVLDEASMVDLNLMSKLISALPERCQLVLLGDKQQLASVEAGNLLAEICQPLEKLPMAEQNQRMPVTELKHSYRFDANGGIGLLATAVNNGRQAAVEHLLVENAVGLDRESIHSFIGGSSQLNWLNAAEHSLNQVVQAIVSHQRKLNALISTMAEHNEDIVVKEAFNLLSQFQVLSCVRQSSRGVEAINKAVKERLAMLGDIDWHAEHYLGRPILITENAYHLGLFNGDLGLQLIEPNSGLLMSYFLNAKGEVVKIFNQRLPAHDSVYAMTVHKSQGSEFDHTVLVMPDDEVGAKLLSRELIYTAITRAKHRFTVYGSKGVINRAVDNKTQRQSGLGYLLYSQ